MPKNTLILLLAIGAAILALALHYQATKKPAVPYVAKPVRINQPPIRVIPGADARSMNTGCQGCGCGGC